MHPDNLMDDPEEAYCKTCKNWIMGICEHESGGIADDNGNLVVEPRLIKNDSPLNISGTLNVIEFNTKYAGPIVLMGRGAGGSEAASAILNDLINIAKNPKYSK